MRPRLHFSPITDALRQGGGLEAVRGREADGWSQGPGERRAGLNHVGGRICVSGEGAVRLL